MNCVILFQYRVANSLDGIINYIIVFLPQVYKQQDDFKSELEISKKQSEHFQLSAEKLDRTNKELQEENSRTKEKIGKEIAGKLVTLHNKLINHKKEFASALSSEV